MRGLKPYVRAGALLCLALVLAAAPSEGKAKAAPAKPAASQPSKKSVSAKKQREARVRSMVDLFCNYNCKLTQQQARNIAGYVLQAAEKFHQEPFVLAAIIVRESGARPSVVSKGGDYGLMQVRWRVHQARIKKEYPQVRNAKDFLDPRINIMVGAEIFSECRAALPPEKRGNVRNGLLRYSAGNAKMADGVLALVKTLEQSYQKYLKTLS